MQRILLVKTSSLGDIVHNLPVVCDIAAAHPGAAIDWVVEEGFSAIPALHPGVAQVIPIAVRRWRKSWWRAGTRGEIGGFVHALRSQRYDAVIDSQGLLKSALVTRAAHGRRYGLDWSSSREPLGLFYDRTFAVPRSGPAVERNRQLAARALGYAPAQPVTYGIVAPACAHDWLACDRYAVLIHATSADDKLWPEDHWIALGRSLEARGIVSVLPWGSAAEHQRSVRLSRAIQGSIVPPRLTLPAVAGVLAQAVYAIGVDTGLTHLAGALGAATVGLYTATDPSRTGLYGCKRAANVGGDGRLPEAGQVERALERLA